MIESVRLLVVTDFHLVYYLQLTLFCVPVVLPAVDAYSTVYFYIFLCAFLADHCRNHLIRTNIWGRILSLSEGVALKGNYVLILHLLLFLLVSVLV